MPDIIMWLGTPASQFIPTVALFLIQLAAVMPWKARDNAPSTWALTICLCDLGRVVFWLQPCRKDFLALSICSLPHSVS